MCGTAETLFDDIRERERETDRQTDRERQRQRDRETQRQTDRDRERDCTFSTMQVQHFNNNNKPIYKADNFKEKPETGVKMYKTFDIIAFDPRGVASYNGLGLKHCSHNGSQICKATKAR